MNKFFKNPWVIGIGTTLVGGIATTIIIDLFSKVSLLSTMKTVLNAIGTGLKAFLNFNIKIWWLLVSIGIIIIVLFIIFKCFDSKEKNTKPAYLEYKEDNIQGYIWRWKWRINLDNKYEIDGLHPVCNKCKTPLIRSDFYSGTLKCPRCHNTIRFTPSIIDEVEIIIYDNIRKNNYVK